MSHEFLIFENQSFTANLDDWFRILFFIFVFYHQHPRKHHYVFQSRLQFKRHFEMFYFMIYRFSRIILKVT